MLDLGLSACILCGQQPSSTCIHACRDVRAAVDLCHRDGSLKREVAENPGKYIHEVRSRHAAPAASWCPCACRECQPSVAPCARLARRARTCTSICACTQPSSSQMVCSQSGAPCVDESGLEMLHRTPACPSCWRRCARAGASCSWPPTAYGTTPTSS